MKKLFPILMALSALLLTGCGSRQATYVAPVTAEPTVYVEATPVLFGVATSTPEGTGSSKTDGTGSVFFATANPEATEVPGTSGGSSSFFVTAKPDTTPVPAATAEADTTAEPDSAAPAADTALPDDSASSEDGAADTTGTEPEQKDTVTIGAVGDIMTMPSQLTAAYDEATGTYSFLRSFTAMTEMFKATDLMCGNMEGCIAGKVARYSNGVTDEEGRIKFNAPDEFAYDLKTVGFDVLTTANNHAADCGAEGIVATIEAIKAAGLYQTGTYADAEDKEIPLVIDANGFKIGILSSTTVINGTSKLSHKQRDAMFSRLQYTDLIAHDVELLKNAGAEFIVMFVHWDKEYKTAPQKSTKKYAQQLLEMGVDAVIGAHPHVVQPMTYMTVTRTDGSSYTGLVAYSLGNFLSNMTGDCAYELFLQMELARDDAGAVYLKSASYMPVLCYAEEVESVDEQGNKKQETIHQVIPCLEDTSLLNCYNGLDAKKLAAITKAREYVLKICGEDTVPVMEDTCWIS